MSDTATLITDSLARCGLDSTPTHVTRAMVGSWLNEAQRQLCAHGRLLATIWRGKSQAGAELYQLPGQFYKITRVEIRDSTFNVNRALKTMTPYERSPNRSWKSGDFPTRFGIWGANDIAATTDNKPCLFFDKNFGDTSASYNFFIWARQKPKDMADGGQGPEVQEYWQDGMKDYAEWRIRARISMANRDEAKLAQIAQQSWLRFLEQSADYRYDELLSPTYPIDEAGLIDPRDGQVIVS